MIGDATREGTRIQSPVVPRERLHEVTRLEGFSDAVFGFALTLLVVSLDVPKNVDDLFDMLRGFLPFALMFSMICWIWYEHQQFFRRYGLQDAWTIAVNCFLLFVVLFYVYPLKYLTVKLIGPHIGMNMAPYGGRALVKGDIILLFYSAGVVLIFGAFVALYRHAWTRRTDLRLSAAEESALRYGMRGHIISMLLGCLSVCLVLVARTIDSEALVFVAGISYILMGPLHAWNGYMGGKAQALFRTREAAAGSGPAA